MASLRLNLLYAKTANKRAPLNSPLETAAWDTPADKNLPALVERIRPSFSEYIEHEELWRTTALCKEDGRI